MHSIFWLYSLYKTFYCEALIWMRKYLKCSELDCNIFHNRHIYMQNFLTLDIHECSTPYTLSLVTHCGRTISMVADGRSVFIPRKSAHLDFMFGLFGCHLMALSIEWKELLRKMLNIVMRKFNRILKTLKTTP